MVEDWPVVWGVLQLTPSGDVLHAILPLLPASMKANAKPEAVATSAGVAPVRADRLVSTTGDQPCAVEYEQTLTLPCETKASHIASPKTVMDGAVPGRIPGSAEPYLDQSCPFAELARKGP